MIKGEICSEYICFLYLFKPDLKVCPSNFYSKFNPTCGFGSVLFHKTLIKGKTSTKVQGDDKY